MRFHHLRFRSSRFPPSPRNAIYSAYLAKWCCWVFLLLWKPALFGQQPELKRLVAESQRLRALTPESAESELPDFGKFTRPSWSGLKGWLRDWIESRLPRNSTELDAAFPGLEARLRAELARAGLNRTG